MYQFLGSVGYDALYKPTTVNSWVWTKQADKTLSLSSSEPTVNTTPSAAKVPPNAPKLS